jgi:hypothetical protein
MDVHPLLCTGSETRPIPTHHIVVLIAERETTSTTGRVITRGASHIIAPILLLPSHPAIAMRAHPHHPVASKLGY